MIVGAFASNLNNAASNSNWNIGASTSYKNKIINNFRVPCRSAKIQSSKVRTSNIREDGRIFLLEAQLNARKTHKKGEHELPKSFNHLFEKTISLENLESALVNSTKDKSDTKGAKKIAQDLNKNKDEVVKRQQQRLLNNEFKAREHYACVVQDISSGKLRVVLKPAIEDEQIIHWAVVQTMQPIFMRGMYEFSCGSIPGRGPDYGRRYIEKFIKNNKADIKYALKIDIKKFYPSINTEILKEKLRRIVHDERMMNLLSEIIDSNVAVFPDGHKERLGVPIGYYTSQWFANFYLQDLDHYAKEVLKFKCYVRYVDDIVAFGRNKKELRKGFEELRKELEKLGLKVKENYQIFRFDYIDKRDGKRKGRFLDFMGFRFYRDRTTLRRARMLKATRKARKISKKKKITWYDSCQMMSLLGPFRHTQTHGVFEKHIKPYVNIKNCRQRIRTRQLKINEKEKNQCSNLDTQKVLKNQKDSTKPVPQKEFTSESMLQLSLFPIPTEPKK